MPVVCITTEAASKRKIAGTYDVRPPKYANNVWGVIKAFENGIVTVVIEENDIIQFTLGEFHAWFIPGMCITVYAAQGTTFEWQSQTRIK